MKAVIFDLNGVFILSPKLSDRFAYDFNVPNEVFLPALKAVMAQVRLPNAPTLYSCWEPYFKEWGVRLDEAGLAEYWFSAEIENAEMVAVARELKARGVRLFILSNNLRERSAYYDSHFPFLNELFEKCYFSWKTGFIKPDTQAFTLVLLENNLEPTDCVYFDDSKENVEVATSLGITCYVFAGVDQVRQLVA
jgi:HAD superfamily hydrolase (TIGR01509 family)